MIVYIIPFLVTIFGAIRYDVFQVQNSAKKIIWFFLYLYLTLLIGLRYFVGGDTFYYHIFFDQLYPLNLFELDFDNDWQPFFIQSMVFAKAIYPEFVSYQILHVFIINSILFWYIKKKSKYIFTVLFFCLLTFYINYTVEVLRESLAIMIFVLHYKYLEEKKWIRYFIGVFFASMFHISALYLLALPFLQFLRLNFYYFLFIIFFTILLTQLKSFLSILETIDKIQEKIGLYAEVLSSLNTTLLFLSAKFIIPIGFLTYSKFVLKQTVRYESLMCLLGLFGIGTIFNTIIFLRLSNYLLLFYCISICDILIQYLRLKNAGSNRLIMFVMIFSSILIVGYASFFWPTGYYGKWVPYVSIFSQEAENGEIIYRE